MKDKHPSRTLKPADKHGPLKPNFPNQPINHHIQNSFEKAKALRPNPLLSHRW